jgi:hypothetical protein
VANRGYRMYDVSHRGALFVAFIEQSKVRRQNASDDGRLRRVEPKELMT